MTNPRTVLLAVMLQAGSFACSNSGGDDDSAAGGSGGTAGSNGGSASSSGGAGGVASGGAASSGGSGGSGGSSGGSAGSGDTGGTNAGGDTSNGGADSRPEIGDTDSQGRELAWADEFDGPEIDREVWGNETGFVRNNELQNYTTDAANQFIEGGELVIKGIYVGGEGQGAYTSASLTTDGKKDFQYGRIEARILVPGATGSWPAFWLLPPGKSWPVGGEIDILEWVSQDENIVYGTAHYQKNGAHEGNGSNTNLGVPVPTDYHVYAIEWTDTVIDWYVDDTHYHTFDISSPIDGETPFNAPFYLILNYAIGGGWPEAPDSSQYPAEMHVDWVRVWQ